MGAGEIVPANLPATNTNSWNPIGRHIPSALDSARTRVVPERFCSEPTSSQPAAVTARSSGPVGLRIESRQKAGAVPRSLDGALGIVGRGRFQLRSGRSSQLLRADWHCAADGAMKQRAIPTAQISSRKCGNRVLNFFAWTAPRRSIPIFSCRRGRRARPLLRQRRRRQRRLRFRRGPSPCCRPCPSRPEGIWDSTLCR